MKKELVVNILRWLARILGFLGSGFFLLFFIGEGGLTEFVWELVPTIILIGLAIVGYVYSWFNERAGGKMMIIGAVGQAFYLILRGGLGDIDAALIFMLPFLIPGLMFLKSQSLRKQ